MSTATAGAVCAEAAGALAELRRLRSEIEALAARLDDDSFQRSPGEGRWSIGECIGHLNQTASVYLRKMPAAVTEARRQGLTGEGPVKRGLFGRVFLWALEPPARVKVKAPRAFLPRPGLTKDETMRELGAIRDDLAGLMQNAGDLDWSRVTMPLPTLPKLKLRLGEVFAVLLAHERRHLWQMRQILKAGV